MNLKKFVDTWKFAVYELSGMNLYLEKGNTKVSLIDDGITLRTWDEVPEAMDIGVAVIWPYHPRVTAYTMTSELVKALNQHAPIEGQEWIKEGTCQASPILRRG